MKRLLAFRNSLLGLFIFFVSSIALGNSYEAKLPEQINSAPQLCDYAPCTEVLPGATSFSGRKGRPFYVEGYVEENGQKRQVGYVMLSTDITDTPAYSGKPIVTLIGMDMKGHFVGVKILKHSEPILLLGIPESSLVHFNNQYLGQFVGDNIEIGRSRREDDVIGLDAISGATVTVIAQNQVMMTAGAAVARQVGILQPTIREQAKYIETGTKLDWAKLVKEGSVQRLTVTPEQIGLPPGDQPFIDLWFGYLNQPDIGRAVLGDTAWRNLMSRLHDGEHALFVIRSGGVESFKGSGFVRGGIYDRVQVRQGSDSFTFRDVDYVNLYGIGVSDAPSFNESAIFIVRSAAFSGAYPWKFVFLGNLVDKHSGAKTFINFEKEYWLPGAYIEGGRPNYERPMPTWLKIWQARMLEIVLFVLLLLAAGITYACRDRLVRRSTRKDKRWVSLPKYALWLTSIGFVGFGLMAQPSITQVLTWFHSILFQWEWGLFLSDPFVFLFWWFIIISTFFWGRGMFCGWLCPYGALTEVAHKMAGRLGLKRFQFQLPSWLHDKLKWLKYGIFAVLLAVSFYSMGTAELMAEVEPFKTTFLVGVWNRSWPFVTFWSVLFVAALFIERPFCKYLCPLGASLAIPSTFRWWGLKRKQECGPCSACESGCASQAIGRDGRIDQRECLLCLDCMVMYYDDHACPPLAKERKARARADIPLTRIGSDGYFIPIQPVAVARTLPQPSHRKKGFFAWLQTEALDHLVPWNRQFLQSSLFFRAAGIGLAVFVTWAWLLGAAGKLGPGVILGWWLAWSIYELLVRMKCKPYVKEGPWWGRNFRGASWADMAAYVGMKNLLIGAGLFLAMKGVGFLSILKSLPELKWLY